MTSLTRYMFIFSIYFCIVQCMYAVKFLRNPLSMFRFGNSFRPTNVTEFSSQVAEAEPSIGHNDSRVGKPAITDKDMLDALLYAREFSLLSAEQITQHGWSTIFQSKLFSLFKRQKGLPNVDIPGSPIEYLMMGEYDEVSPLIFLKSQVEESSRRLWDKSMQSMLDGKICLVTAHVSPPTDQNVKCTEDVVYCRAGWPWPLQDRDYVLRRKCKLFDKDGAIVLVSKSTENAKFPLKKETVRVDKYESRAVFMSTHPTVPLCLSTPGVKFVSIFCDEQKVAIPPGLMDMITKQVEKLTRGTMEQLHSVAVMLQKNFDKV